MRRKVFENEQDYATGGNDWTQISDARATYSSSIRTERKLSLSSRNDLRQ